jgi:hypothetical protein
MSAWSGTRTRSSSCFARGWLRTCLSSCVSQTQHIGTCSASENDSGKGKSPKAPASRQPHIGQSPLTRPSTCTARRCPPPRHPRGLNAHRRTQSRQVERPRDPARRRRNACRARPQAAGGSGARRGRPRLRREPWQGMRGGEARHCQFAGIFESSTAHPKLPARHGSLVAPPVPCLERDAAAQAVNKGMRRHPR